MDKSLIDFLFSGAVISSTEFSVWSSGELERTLARAMQLTGLRRVHMTELVCGELSLTPTEYRDWLLRRDALSGAERGADSYWDEVRSTFAGRRIMYVCVCGRLSVWDYPHGDGYSAQLTMHSSCHNAKEPAYPTVRAARSAAQRAFPDAIPAPEGFWKRVLRLGVGKFLQTGAFRPRPASRRLWSAVHRELIQMVYLVLRRQIPDELTLAEMM